MSVRYKYLVWPALAGPLTTTCTGKWGVQCPLQAWVQEVTAAKGPTHAYAGGWGQSDLPYYKTTPVLYVRYSPLSTH
jgi:hypothetical protein